MLVVGLTGGIASGKSFVADCFVSLGSERINADQIGHQVLREADVVQAIANQWGESVLQSDGQVDRRELAKRVFQKVDGKTYRETDTVLESREKLKNAELEILESITHPRIGERIREQLNQFKLNSKKPAVVLDAPVMFKAGWDQACDRIVFVHAELEIRQQRATQRGWSEDELMRREADQLPLEAKRDRSTDFIDNSNSQEMTIQQINQLWQDWNLANDSSMSL